MHKGEEEGEIPTKESSVPTATKWITLQKSVIPNMDILYGRNREVIKRKDLTMKKNGGSQQVYNLNLNSETQRPANQVLKEDTNGTSLSDDQIQRLLKLLDEKIDSKHVVSLVQGTSSNFSTHKL